MASSSSNSSNSATPPVAAAAASAKTGLDGYLARIRAQKKPREPSVDDATRPKKKTTSNNIATPVVVAAAVATTTTTTSPSAVSATSSDTSTAHVLAATHIDIAQPSTERAEELLGPAPPAPAQNPRDVQAAIANAEKQRVEFDARIEKAKRRGKNVYYNAAQVAERYGRKNALSEFIRASTGQQSTATATAQKKTTSTGVKNSNAGGVDDASSTMRIDELITSQENSRAADELNTVRVVLADTNSRRLQTDMRPPTIDEFIERLNMAASGAAIGDIDNRLFERPYQVVGLSESVPNPDWEQMLVDRQALIARRASLMQERRALSNARQFIGAEGSDSLAPGSLAELRRNEARRRAQQFARPEDIELLKPDSQVAALNLRWRTLLLTVLKQENDRYALATTAYLRHTVAQSNGTLPGLPSLYQQLVVGPVFDRYVAQIRSSTYEDMPLTAEVLEEYLYNFLNYLYTMTLAELRDDPPSGAPAVTVQSLRDATHESTLIQRKQQLRSLIGLNTRGAPGNRDVEETTLPSRPTPLGPAATDALPERDETPHDLEIDANAEYLRQALNIHASQIYIGWLRIWLAEARKANDNGAGGGGGGGDASDDEKTRADNEAKLLIIERRVRNMVRDREEVELRRNLARGRTLPRYVPQSEAMIRDSFAMLLRNEVASARAKSLVAQDALWLDRLVDFITEKSNVPPIVDMLVRPRIDIVLLLGRAKELALGEARTLFAKDTETFDKVSDLIDERTLDLSNAILLYAPRVDGYVYYDHAPLDTASNPDATPSANDSLWSPYNLAYPLAVDATERQGAQLQTFVLTHTDNFDAEALHRRANELRSMLSFDYAERLVLRAIAEITYYLEKVLVPELHVALQREISIDARQSITLSASLELRPELEMGRRLPTATRDPRIDEFFDALGGVANEVTWFHTPYYGLRAGRETVVFKETLPRGHLTSTYTLTATGKVVENDRALTNATDLLSGDEEVELKYHATNESIGGTYRVEFRALNATGAVYRSLFHASVRVLAHCKRDGATFEVGTQRAHGECQWREYARDASLLQVVDEWRVLVLHGQAAFQDLLARRRQESELRRATGYDYELFLPPWGAEDEQSLLRTFRSAQSDECFERQFNYYEITRRVVARLAGQMRRLIRAGLVELEQFEPTDAAERSAKVLLATHLQALASANSSNMALFSILVAGMRASEPMIRALHVRAAKQSVDGGWSSPERVARIDDGPTGKADINATLQHLTSTLLDIAHSTEPPRIQRVVADADADAGNTYAPPLPDTELPLRVRKVKVLEPGTTRSVEGVPLATMLNALYLPTVWPNLTWREKRFFNKLAARFDHFAEQFRFVERRRLYYGGLLRDDKQLDFAPMPVSLDNDRKTPFNREPEPTPLQRDTEERIDRRLADMLPAAVQESPAWYDVHRMIDSAVVRRPEIDFGVAGNFDATVDSAKAAFLQDDDLCREWDERVQGLIRAGLVVPNRTVFTRNVTVLDNAAVPVAWRVATLQTQVDFTTDERGRDVTAAATHRQDWVGKHSYVTQQPEFCQLLVDPTRGAAINVRGSAPVNKGYDFDGLFELMLDTVRQYTNIVRGGHPEVQGAGAMQRAMRKLEVRLQRLELTYNFLAFIAPPLTGMYLSADAILQIIDDQGSERWLTALRATIY